MYRLLEGYVFIMIIIFFGCDSWEDKRDKRSWCEMGDGDVIWYFI